MKKQFAFLLGLGALLLLPGLVAAQSNFTGTGDGTTWNEAANWDAGVPDGVNADIGDTFEVTLATDQSIFELDLVGDQSEGTASLDHTSGTLTSGGWMKIGGLNTDIAAGDPPPGSPNTGTYNMSGTASAVGQTTVHVGFAEGEGTLNLSDNANFQCSEGLNIASGNASGLATVGQNSTGTLNISGSATLTVDRLNTGGAGSTAVVNQTGGTLSSNNWIALANFSPGETTGTATYNISAGSLAANNGNFAVGQEGNGTLNVSGTAVVSQSAAGDNSFLVGGIADGALIEDGTGTLSITGSSASVSGVALRIGLTPASIATLSWTADAGGVTAFVSADNTEFGGGTSSLVLDLSADSASSTAGTEYLLVDNAAAVSGTFTGVAEGASVDIGGGVTGTITYAGGSDGFDIVVTSDGGGGLIGDVNTDGVVDFFDIQPFIDLLSGQMFQFEADINGDEVVDFFDIQPFIDLLAG